MGAPRVWGRVGEFERLIGGGLEDVLKLARRRPKVLGATVRSSHWNGRLQALEALLVDDAPREEELCERGLYALA
jgi:hypothetical protein